MINDDAVRAIQASRWTDYFIRPLYETYCFAQLPDLVRHLLTGRHNGNGALPRRLLGSLADSYESVILFFVDAFGWRFVEPRLDRYPFLQRLMREGMVTPLTSQFPSTTAAHVTAIHTGLPVGESGIHEWFYYEPKLDRIIAPLPFCFAGDHTRDTLRRYIAPAEIYPHRTLYHDLEEHGVCSVVFQHQDYAPSPYSATVCGGACLAGYKTLSEALIMLEDVLLKERGRPMYYVLYFDRIDAICHRHGPASPHLDAEIDSFLTMMDRLFHHKLAGTLSRTLFLMTADHGQIEVDPATTIYLNLQLPRLERYIKRNRSGLPLVPAGSPRDMFLYIDDQYLDEAEDLLRSHLDGRADVCRVADLIDQGFFGPHISQTFLDRVGNLVVLPYPGESVWWYEKGVFEQPYYGHHGGLTRQEMGTVLLALPYD